MGCPPKCTAWVLVLVLCGLSEATWAKEYRGNPSNYTSLLGQLKAGDVLRLAAGSYSKDLNVRGLRGTASAWITITGPSSGAPARFVARSCCNTVELVNSSYVAIEHLTLDGGGTKAAFGVSAKGGNGNLTHHIRIAHCTIQDYNGSQQIVGISTKTPTWGWQIQHNRILRPGTGLYLGNSNGKEPFFDAVIEGNLVLHPTGYGMQIKHQLSRGSRPGMPTKATKVLIRHNVFVKDDRPSPSGDRPTLLLGGFPEKGLGAQDIYEVYGNLFAHNPRESLLQATGRFSIHDNVFVDVAATAMVLRTHNLALRLAHVYNNTIYGAKRGISLGSKPSEGHHIVGNLIFAAEGITGATNAKDNLVYPVSQAAQHVRNPTKKLGQVDLYPLPGKCVGPALDLSPFAQDTDGRLDFNGTSKGSLRFRGAYAGQGANPGWKLDGVRKPLPSPQPPPKEQPPAEPPAEPPPPPTEATPSDAGPEPSHERPTERRTPPEPKAEAGQTELSQGQDAPGPDASPAEPSRGPDAAVADSTPPKAGCGCQHHDPGPVALLLLLLALLLRPGIRPRA